jgi:hypothetical protein
MLPLGPDGVSIDSAPQDLGGEIRNASEDLHPVLADLLFPDEASLRVGRCLVPVVRSEAGDQGLQVVGVGRLIQAVH